MAAQMNQEDVHIAFQAGWRLAALECLIELQQAVLAQQRLLRDTDPGRSPEFVRYHVFFLARAAFVGCALVSVVSAMHFPNTAVHCKAALHNAVGHRCVV